MFYCEFVEIKPADDAIHELLEERYNPYYKAPEDCTDDELVDLLQESLSTFGEVQPYWLLMGVLI